MHKSKPQIVHRDLKPGNLLIGRNGEIKVSDFGLSETLKESGANQDTQTRGSPLWMAPEVLLGQEYDLTVDTYAFGIILWQAVTREEPFLEFESYESFLEAVTKHRVRPRIPRSTPEAISRLIEQCWQQNPRNRPSFDRIVPQLDAILVQVAIRDPVGLRFWQKHFPGREGVSWEDFLPAYLALLDDYGCQIFHPLPAVPNAAMLHAASQFQLEELRQRGPRQAQMVVLETTRREEAHIDPYQQKEDLQLRCLQMALFDSPPTEKSELSLEEFGSFLDWFGPMALPKSGNGVSAIVLHQNVTAILCEPWFHGDIDAKMAGERLINGAPGSFLVRFSSIAGCFTVSCTDSTRAIKHYRVVSDEQRGFCWNTVEAPTLPLFVANASKIIGLQSACLGSKYLAELQKHENSVSGYLQN